MDIARLLLTAICFVSVSCASLEDIKAKLESYTDKLANKILYEYQRCSDEIIDCRLLSYNMCNGTGKRECLTNFPTPAGCLF